MKSSHFRFTGSAFLAFLLFSIAFLRADTLNLVYIGDSITAGGGNHSRHETNPPENCTIELKKTGLEVFDSNQGFSGHTTTDYLPTKNDYPKAVAAANQLVAAHPDAKLLFAIMLGTNDSAQSGTNGAALPAKKYHQNLKALVDQLLTDFPTSLIVIHHPTWYSPNTHNSANYGRKGLDRLKTYGPEVDSLVSEYNISKPGQVFVGDQQGFKLFEDNYQTLLYPEQGQEGTFYLHPGKEGAEKLGALWAEAILKAIGQPVAAANP